MLKCNSGARFKLRLYFTEALTPAFKQIENIVILEECVKSCDSH